MADCPIYVQLTSEQVASVIQSYQAGKDAASLAAQLSERALCQAIPPISAWEAYERAAPASRQYSLVLLRGLRLLAQLAGGQPASLNDLASDLNLSPGAASAYIQTLTITGMVEQDPYTHTYRLAR